MNPLIGMDEICDATDQQKTLLCGFTLSNHPYNLKTEPLQSPDLRCKQDELTLINMYECPFNIIEDDEEEEEEEKEETSYLISRGGDKTTAIVYQRNADGEIFLDGEV